MIVVAHWVRTRGGRPLCRQITHEMNEDEEITCTDPRGGEASAEIRSGRKMYSKMKGHGTSCR
jgi:hypothetical protein